VIWKEVLISCSDSYLSAWKEGRGGGKRGRSKSASASGKDPGFVLLRFLETISGTYVKPSRLKCCTADEMKCQSIPDTIAFGSIDSRTKIDRSVVPWSQSMYNVESTFG